MSDLHDVEELAPTPGQRLKAALAEKDVRVTIVFGIIITAFFVFIGLWFYPKFMPEVMSENMERGRDVIVYFTVITAPIAGVVIAVALYTLLNRHQGDTPPAEAANFRGHTPIIFGWTIVSALFCIVAIVWGLTEMNVNAEANATNAKTALTVEVTGSQWVWTFNYPELGVQSPNLNLPIDRPVIFKVTSVDVNHSFWPVQLGVKVDANDKVTTLARTTPNKLGHIEVKCAELCGLYHAYMETQGEVMAAADFNQWVTSLGGHTA
jgi:cytochrome c oxidase subunit 2